MTGTIPAMQMIRSALAGLLALFVASAALAQTFPTVPAQSVIGRLGTPGVSGPSSAIPFATVLSSLGGSQTANKVWAGPTSGGAAAPTFRALVGADLPAPSATTLGGAKSLTCAASNWFNTLSTAGAFGCSQPNFTDLAGSISAAQIPAGTIVNAAISNSAAIALSKLATQSANTAVCNATGGAAVPTECSKTQLTALVNVATTGLTGAAPVLPNDGTKFLNGLGAYATPTSAGTHILLATLTASNSANLADTTNLTATYNAYELIFTNLLPATNTQTCQLQVNVAGVQATTYLGVVLGANTTGSVTASGGTTFIPCSTPLHVSNAGSGISGTCRVFNPSQTASPKMWTCFVSYPSTLGSVEFTNTSGFWNGGNGAVTGFQVSMSSGNLTSGTIKIYGIQ